MIEPRTSLRPEDKGRLIGYSLGVAWALVFGIWTPTTYAGVVSLLAVHTWSLLMGAGCLVALVGVLTGRDTKVELSGIYLCLSGALLYLVAQIGFSGLEFRNRLPLLIFIGWHMSLLLPRLFGLEAYRRAQHAAARAQRVQGRTR